MALYIRQSKGDLAELIKRRLGAPSLKKTGTGGEF